jgi:hypothetical protein
MTRMCLPFPLPRYTCAPCSQYSLDGSQWADTKPVFRVGPLGTGPHLVQVRGVTSAGVELDPSGSLGLLLGVQWNVVSASNSTLTLTDITDGTHTLKVRSRRCALPRAAGLFMITVCS